MLDIAYKLVIDDQFIYFMRTVCSVAGQRYLKDTADVSCTIHILTGWTLVRCWGL